MKSFFLTIFAGLMMTMQVAMAQVATPSLDATQPTLVAAASVWRFGSTIAAGSSTHEYKSPNNQFDYESAESSGLISWQPTQVIFDLYGTSGAKSKVWDSVTDTYTDQARDDFRFGVSIRGDGEVGLGIGVQAENITDSLGQIRNRTSNHGNLSFRMGNAYLAGGIGKMTEKVETIEDKKWNRVFFGAAYRYGTPESNQFRIEYSLVDDSGVTGGDTWLAIVPKSRKALTSVEFNLWGLLFTYEGSTLTESAVLDWTTDRVTLGHRYGFGLVGDTFSINIYRRDGKQNHENQEQLFRHFGVTLGFHFI